MTHRTLLAVLAAALLAAVAPAQAPARAELFTRVDGAVVRAAIEIQLDGDWHIYHRELGHPKAVGQPTVIELSGEGIAWGEVWFPEPVRLDQSDVAGPGAFIQAHEHELVVYAVGSLATGAAGTDVQAKIKALVCEDIQGCIPFRRTLESKGRGRDALFAAFPADLVAPPAPEIEGEEDAPLLGGETSSGVFVEDGPGADVPTEDEIRKDGADTTLYVRVNGARVEARMVVDIDPDRHLYHVDLGPSPYGKPAQVTLHGAGIEWGPIEWPEPLRFDQSDIEEGLYINGHEGRIVLKATGTVAAGATVDPRTIWGEINGQTCDPSTCSDYEEVFVAQGAGPDDLWSGTAATTPTPRGPSVGGGDEASASADRDEFVEEDVLGEGLGGFLLAAVFWGLFTLLMPCTYPMIPITISFFTKQADRRGGNVLSLALAYGAGIVGIFVLIGVSFGSVIIPFANHWVTNLVIGVAFVYFSLTLFGLVNLQPPRFLMNAAGAASTKGGYLGVFLMGATLVVTSFTCTAPFVGTLLGSAGNRTVPEVALGMGVFGLTMATPFVLLSLVPGRIKAMPRSGEWMNTLKFSLGFVELAAALKFLSNVDVDRGLQVVSREFFLVVWGVIALVMGAYLLGAGRLLGRPAGTGGLRRLFGTLAVLFGLFCFWGLPGRKMGEVMSAFLPPYSGGRLFPQWYDPGSDWQIVTNDYDAARALAQEQKKLLLVNFTGEL
jgi:cytochrome c biogenesis protein CcdA/DsbC/DsbD-like thiol-disulfide interchange protein